MTAFVTIADLLGEESVEDIMINGTSAFVLTSASQKRYMGEVGWDEVAAFIGKVKESGGDSKIIDCTIDMNRVNLILPPVSLEPVITIRKFRKNPISMVQLLEFGMLTEEMAALLWLAVDGLGSKINILVAGETGSGKTTLLNAMLGLAKESERIVTAEDTYELNLKHKNLVRLKTSPEYPMQSLVKTSLRMTPDRIIIGEVRGAEAVDLMVAMNLGISCMGTIHANSSRDVIIRLESAPMNVPQSMVSLIDLVVVAKKVGTRFVSEITEVGNVQDKNVELGMIWKNDTGVFQKVFSPVTIRKKMANAAGMSEKEVLDEIEKRAKFFSYLRNQGVSDYEHVKASISAYN